MATPNPAAQQNPLFPLLVAKYGLSTALSVMSLLNPDQPAAAKGIGAAGLAGSLANTGGRLAGNAGLAGLGRGLGQAAGAGALGYNIYGDATNPNLSTKQKAGHAASDAGQAALAAFVPYAGLGLAARAITGALERSGSPQVSATGKALAAPARPVEALLSVLQGDQSPRAAANAMIRAGRDTPILGKVISPIADLFGLGTKPTTGTSYRQGLQNIFGKVGLKDFNRADKNVYNAPKAGAVSPDALALGAYLGSYAPGFEKNPEAYANQAANILTNTYGKDLPGVLKGINTKLQLTPAEAMSRFQNLRLSPDFLNRLQVGSVLFGAAAK